ncbi:hypothetical protein HZS_280 [Henneguya salminicola]|nr:hypothetical protein HZS_280 [Henneguya salminicola]
MVIKFVSISKKQKNISTTTSKIPKTYRRNLTKLEWIAKHVQSKLNSIKHNNKAGDKKNQHSPVQNSNSKKSEINQTISSGKKEISSPTTQIPVTELPWFVIMSNFNQSSLEIKPKKKKKPLYTKINQQLLNKNLER